MPLTWAERASMYHFAPMQTSLVLATDNLAKNKQTNKKNHTSLIAKGTFVEKTNKFSKINKASIYF